jgi:hypothetical protein
MYSKNKSDFRPKVFSNSIPKSGTHLLAQVLLNMGFVNKNTRDGDLVRLTPLDEIEQIMKLLNGGEYISGHRDYSKEFNNILKKHKVSHILIVRDPRDVVISRTFYILKKPTHKLFAHFNGISRNECFIASIKGVDWGNMLSIAEVYNRFLPWLNKNSCLVVRFEDLIGTRGGGSDEKQFEVLTNIAKHFGIPLEKSELKEIAYKAFNEGSPTFRKGQIGDWANWLDDEMQAIIKKDTGIFKKYGYSI